MLWGARSLVLLLLALCLLLPAWAGKAHNLTLHGEVILEDGTPVIHGEVQITELRNRFFAMPAVAGQYVVYTDEQGHFGLELSNAKGDLDIRLQESPCHWKAAFTYIGSSDYKGQSELMVRFTPSQGPWLEDCAVQESESSEETTQQQESAEQDQH